MNDHASSAAAPPEEANRERAVRRWRQALIRANLLFGDTVPNRHAKLPSAPDSDSMPGGDDPLFFELSGLYHSFDCIKDGGPMISDLSGDLCLILLPGLPKLADLL